jgi:outer membrane protein OmpA-like peptidoglycan-associated protein
MKTLASIALKGVLVLYFTGTVYAQLSDPRSYYVVIGAFAVKKNAINFTRSAARAYAAKYECNPGRNLDYVYILKTDDKEKAVEEAMRLRTTTKYDDTWVYHGVLGKDADSYIQGQDIDPSTWTPVAVTPVADNKTDMQSLAQTGQPSAAGSGVQENALPAAGEDSQPEESFDPKAKLFFFKIQRVDTKAVIEGSVDVIDTERARKLGTYDANKNVRVSPPAKPEGGISLICEVFGYRKVQRDINFAEPEGEGITREGDAVVVPFELMRLQKGDIATMFHVYFFKDAAVMRPESRYEVNSLVEMMEENPKYKIRIHGHTNGNAPGKITTLDKGAENFFSLNNTSDAYGSAKKLSEMRAELLRDFLIANGVDEKRLQVKAWGGKKPIFDKFHAQAQANVRVEIEILDN